MVLHLIGMLGASAGTGYAVEFSGPAVRGLDMEGRMTLCNLSIELGAKIGMIAPDDVTFSYLEGRECSPKGSLFDLAVEIWKQLMSGDDAVFDKEVSRNEGGVGR